MLRPSALLAVLFGAGLTMDAFVVAFRIPNLLRRLFAEGAFSQAFVPVLGEYRTRQGDDATRLLAGKVLAVLTVVLFAMTLVGVVAAPAVVYLTSAGFAKDAETGYNLKPHQQGAGKPNGPYRYYVGDRNGIDSQLHGAFIVDSTGPAPNDRVFVLGSWTGPPDKDSITADLRVINGLSWPHTERLTYTAGDTIRWRWVNPTDSPHPIHLHGHTFKITGTEGGTIPPSAQWPADTVNVPPGST